MTVQIYRNTTEGFKLCEGEYFEHDGFRFCITAIEYKGTFSIHAIEYTTGFDAIPPELNFVDIPKKKNISKEVEQIKEALKRLNKCYLASRINKARKSHYCKSKFPLNK